MLNAYICDTFGKKANVLWIGWTGLDPTQKASQRPMQHRGAICGLGRVGLGKDGSPGVGKYRARRDVQTRFLEPPFQMFRQARCVQEKSEVFCKYKYLKKKLF